MPLPKSIEKLGERADEIMRAQMGTPATPTPEPPKQPVAEPAPAPAPAEPIAAPAPTPAIADWEQRFKVLQGKYSAEVPRLHGEVKELKTQLQTALAELSELKNRAPAPAASLDLTPEEREQYDPQFLEVVAKVAKAQVPQQPAQAQDPELANRLKQLEQVVEESREDKFFRELGDLAPTWKALNTDAAFLQWLAEDDGFSGRTRQELFNEAFGRYDVQRIARFFNAYGGNQSNVSRSNAAPSLEDQVTPRPNGSVPPPPAGKPIYTTRDIATFYARVRRGDFNGNEAEMQRIEQDIFAAQREGRVRK